MEIEVTVQNKTEFDQAIQRYIESGYELESNIGDTAVLRKKGFKLWIFIVLLFFLIIAAVLYYFFSDDNIVILKNANNSNFNNERYCGDCGIPVGDEAKYCPRCGAEINVKSGDVSARVVEGDAFKI